MLLVLSTLVLFACGAPNNVDAKSGGFTDCSFTYPEITMELGDSVNIFDVNPVTYSPSNLDVRIVYEIADNNIVDLSGNILHAVRVDSTTLTAKVTAEGTTKTCQCTINVVQTEGNVIVI